LLLLICGSIVIVVLRIGCGLLNKTKLDHFRNRAFIIVILVIVGFACYFDRPILWNTFHGMILNAFYSLLVEWVIISLLVEKW
jgi:hypothetical protein